MNKNDHDTAATADHIHQHSHSSGTHQHTHSYQFWFVVICFLRFFLSFRSLVSHPASTSGLRRIIYYYVWLLFRHTSIDWGAYAINSICAHREKKYDYFRFILAFFFFFWCIRCCPSPSFGPLFTCHFCIAHETDIYIYMRCTEINERQP